jgi:hypothetical protein
MPSRRSRSGSPTSGARRGWILAAVLGLAAVLAFTGLTGAAGAAGKQVPANWDVTGVGPHGRSLDLVYLTGGCLSPTPETSVTETTTSITIVVTLTDTSGPGIACPEFLRYATTTVALSTPLAGRVILGRPTPGIGGYPGGVTSPGGALRVPRLIGFAPSDARHTLTLYGLGERRLEAARRHGLARVIFQAPGPGSSIPRGATMTVRLSRPPA